MAAPNMFWTHNQLQRDFEGQHQVAESVFFCDSCTEAAVFTG